VPTRGSSLDHITGAIVDEAMRLHKRLGPGLLEGVYEGLLAQLIARRGLHVERQKQVTFEIDGLRFENGLRVDLLVEGQVIVELKAVEQLAPAHARQLLTYLRLMDLRLGLLLNFGAHRMSDGIRRVVNRYEPAPAQDPSAALR
jgi:GxxExxY protein